MAVPPAEKDALSDTTWGTLYRPELPLTRPARNGRSETVTRHITQTGTFKLEEQ